jgi:hypothetical protein
MRRNVSTIRAGQRVLPWDILSRVAWERMRVQKRVSDAPRRTRRNVCAIRGGQRVLPRDILSRIASEPIPTARISKRNRRKALPYLCVREDNGGRVKEEPLFKALVLFEAFLHSTTQSLNFRKQRFE